MMVDSIGKANRVFSTKSEIDLFLHEFLLSNDYPHVTHSNSGGGLGGLRCHGIVMIIVETHVGQRELFHAGGCGNHIGWVNHEDLSFSGTQETELDHWLSGLGMGPSSSLPDPIKPDQPIREY